MKAIVFVENAGLAPDYGGTEEALKVAAARELEARDDFFSHGCPADDVAPLEHGN